MALGGALGPAWSRVTPRHFCVAGVALGDIHLDFTCRFAWQAWHSFTPCHTPSFNFVRHSSSSSSSRRPHVTHNTTLSHTTQLCHTQLSYTTLSTSIFHTPSFTHNFHTQLCHTPSFTHPLSHTLLSHTICNISYAFRSCWPKHELISRRVTQVELAFALCNLSPYHPMMFAALVAPACFIFRHVFCFASFHLLACLRMSCCGMFYGRSGMFMFRHVSSVGLFRHV